MYNSLVYPVLKFWGHVIMVVRFDREVFVLTDFLFSPVLVQDLCQPSFFKAFGT